MRTPSSLTGQSSISERILAGGLRRAKNIANMFGVDLGTQVAPIIATTRPPRMLTFGLDVQRSEFRGWDVWTLRARSQTQKHVVGIHGGAFVVQPSIIHWFDYCMMARDTRATVTVPIYPLAPQHTASTVVPDIADFIRCAIEQHGAHNVSIYGDSAGGGIALSAVQELVRRAAPTPARMVLLSPVLDATLSNPDIELINDPLLSAAASRKCNLLWAGDLDPRDPLVSPLYGSLSGLPPTAIYAGSLELLFADVVVLQQKAAQMQDCNLTFVLRKGAIHDWALPLHPAGRAVRPDIYRQLLGAVN